MIGYILRDRNERLAKRTPRRKRIETLIGLTLLLVVIAAQAPNAQHARDGTQPASCYEQYATFLNEAWGEYDQCFRDTASWSIGRRFLARTGCRNQWISNAIQGEAMYVGCVGARTLGLGH